MIDTYTLILLVIIIAVIFLRRKWKFFLVFSVVLLSILHLNQYLFNWSTRINAVIVKDLDRSLTIETNSVALLGNPLNLTLAATELASNKDPVSSDYANELLNIASKNSYETASLVRFAEDFAWSKRKNNLEILYAIESIKDLHFTLEMLEKHHYSSRWSKDLTRLVLLTISGRPVNYAGPLTFQYYRNYLQKQILYTGTLGTTVAAKLYFLYSRKPIVFNYFNDFQVMAKNAFWILFGLMAIIQILLANLITKRIIKVGVKSSESAPKVINEKATLGVAKVNSKKSLDDVNRIAAEEKRRLEYIHHADEIIKIDSYVLPFKPEPDDTDVKLVSSPNLRFTDLKFLKLFGITSFTLPEIARLYSISLTSDGRFIDRDTSDFQKKICLAANDLKNRLSRLTDENFFSFNVDLDFISYSEQEFFVNGSEKELLGLRRYFKFFFDLYAVDVYASKIRIPWDQFSESERGVLNGFLQSPSKFDVTLSGTVEKKFFVFGKYLITLQLSNLKIWEGDNLLLKKELTKQEI